MGEHKWTGLEAKKGKLQRWREVPQNAKAFFGLVDLRVQNLAQTQLSHGSSTWYESRSFTPEIG